MPDYRYELRRGEDIVATGAFQAPSVRSRSANGSRSTATAGSSARPSPLLSERELRLVVQLCCVMTRPLPERRARAAACGSRWGDIAWCA
jgi:hypothetical protein